ncbi:MAG: hypothetical protein JSV62_02995 [Promethearchaeota archaeon]|nr:MAG: hypothetical protein JSV62_02995 [Candidatus Lokiarchaeota archaeon]
MAKKKKKEKKKKLQDSEAEADQIPEYSLNSALHSAKSTETTLQTLLKGVSEGQGFLKPQKEGDMKITPQLSHESRSKIAEAYVLEDVPLVQQTKDEKKERTKLVTEANEKTKPVEPIDKPEVSLTSEVQPAPPSTIKEPSFIKQKNIYLKLTEFFEGLLTSYNENYDRWEMSISNILSILRKMRKITKKNTEDLVGNISGVYDKIQANLEQFKVKRDEIETVAEVDIESMSGEFKRVLGLLELQVKEYQLKRITDEFIHKWKYNE